MAKLKDKNNEKVIDSQKLEDNNRFIDYLFYAVAIFFFITM